MRFPQQPAHRQVFLRLDKMNIDILNAFRFLNHGVDMHQQPQQDMPEDLFNALAFAQANPDAVDNPAGWVTSPEWLQATQEAIAEIIGVNTHYF